MPGIRGRFILNPPAITILLLFLSALLIIVFDKTRALVVFILVVSLIPSGNAINIGPASFYPMRLLAIFGFIRILIKRELFDLKLNKVDFYVICWSITLLIVGAIQPKLDSSFITRVGEVYTLSFTYFILRSLIKDEKDIEVLMKMVVLIFGVIAVGMFYEKMKGFNLFSYLGGVSPYGLVRDGRLRCQGPFSISILAGTVPATTFSWLLVLLWQKTVNKAVLIAGLFFSLANVSLCASSGPIMSMAFVVVGFSVWPFRRNLKQIRTIVILVLVAMHFMMKTPIWYLISRIDLTGSSTGYHRSLLIDRAIMHFDEWWLWGASYTRHWMPTGVSWSPNQVDITNQYLVYGVNGGLFTMLFFIMIVFSSFGLIGKGLRMVGYEDRKNQFLLWGLGATLFSHAITFLTVSYMDQSVFYFYILLAMIGCITGPNYKFETDSKSV